MDPRLTAHARVCAAALAAKQTEAAGTARDCTAFADERRAFDARRRIPVRLLAFLLACLLPPLSALAEAPAPSATPSPAPSAPPSAAPSAAPSATPNGFLSDSEYRDASLHVRIEEFERDQSVYHVAYVEVADPAQLCTAIAGTPEQPAVATVGDMARASGAILAINGDYYGYADRGPVVRQGVLLRQSRRTKYDMLFIDAAGDLRAIRKPGRKAVEAAMVDHDVRQWFSFGPVLVMDGAVQPIRLGYGFSPQDRSPRTAIGQLGERSYVLVVVDGRVPGSRGVTHEQLARFLGELGCTVAFNLDGGGSSEMWFGGAIRNTLKDGEERELSDIVYFRSAE